MLSGRGGGYGICVRSCGLEKGEGKKGERKERKKEKKGGSDEVEGMRWEE